MSELREWVRGVDGFDALSNTKKIRLFAWYLHAIGSKERFTVADIRRCFDEIHADPPKNISQHIADMSTRTPREVLKDIQGYYLERKVREALDAKFGQRAITMQVLQTLKDLPGKLPNLAERAYFEEALICFKHGAFRAAAIMTWNLAYDHLCTHILNNRLGDFNAHWLARHSKNKPVSVREDFHEMKEAHVLETCRAAGILGKNVYAVMDEKLNGRNRVAHASGQGFLQPQAEGYILDLVNNALLVL